MFFGCSPCTCECTIGADAFDGDLAQWTTAGSVSVAAGLLEMAGASSAFFAPEPLSDDDGVIIRTHPLAAGNGKLRLIAARLDASNYLFGEFEISAGGTVGTLRLGEVRGGALTWLTDTITVADVDFSARTLVALCWQPGTPQTPASSNTGWTSPRQAAGTDWANPTNALLCAEDQVARYDVAPAGGTQDFLVWDFQLNVPPGATIDGIEVSTNVMQGGNTDAEDQSVFLQYALGVAVGDNHAVPTTLPTTELDGINYGGAADDWNATPTWLLVNGKEFGAQFTYRHADPADGVLVDIDCVAINAHYTTADHTSGRLSLAYTNGDTTVDCVTERAAFGTGGLQTGIHVAAGDWDFSDFSLDYLLSAGRPTCPDCGCAEDAEPCSCCDPEFPASSAYVATLDDTLLDDNCVCSSIGGEYLLESGGLQCSWFYRELLECDDIGGAQNSLGSHFGISLNLYADEGGCFWSMLLSIAGPQFGGTGLFPNYMEAGYTSGYLATTEDCRTMPVTLTRDFQRELGGTQCNPSTFPAEVIIDLP